jgi:large subunit ribosomal protein L23
VTFAVHPDANKIEIKRAVERLFDVQVLAVRTSKVRGKLKRRGRFEGRRPSWKKARVQLRDGDNIEFFEGV